MLIVAGPSGEAMHRRAGHPERPARVEAAMAGVDDLHLGATLVVVPAVEAPIEDLVRVHHPGYLAWLEAFCGSGGGDLDPDTYAGVDSWHAARLSAGAGLAALDELRSRDDGVALVLARPPGHHAESGRAMGFCLVNNIAVAAARLVADGERVLVVDWDVHHGNGTQAIFWDEPNVCFVSTHQWRLYPGTGDAEETGGDGAPGLTVNVPVPAGATGDVVLRGIEEVAMPTIEAFGPTWVLVSAGFDAHRADPLAELQLSSGDFAALARLAAGCVRRRGRVAMFLEGGYDLQALRSSAAAAAGALVAEGFVADEQPTSGGPGAEMVELALTERRASLGD